MERLHLSGQQSEAGQQHCVLCKKYNIITDVTRQYSEWLSVSWIAALPLQGDKGLASG